MNVFELLKKKLTSTPIVVAPDWNLPFEFMCDASDFAVGVILGQQKEKVFYAIYYASRMLNDAQLNYATTEKELLAVVFAFDKFRPYLIRNKVIVFTNHSAIKYLMIKKTQNLDLFVGCSYCKNLMWRFEIRRVPKIW